MSERITQRNLISTTIKTNSFQSALKLSPNDWVIPSSASIRCIYFYDIQQWSLYKKQPDKQFMNTEQMIASLRKLLEFYPLLNGVFKVIDEDKKVLVEPDDVKGGILFVSTTVNSSLNELRLLDEEFNNANVIPSTLQLLNIVGSETLFHVRHTRFLCGSVALGISLNHQLADAHSYFQIVKDWALLYKTAEYQPNVCHRRSLLELTEEEINVLKNSNPDFNNRRSLAVEGENVSSPPTTKEIITKVFRFSARELERMKFDSITHLPSDIDYVSTFEVLTAHLYRHVMLARDHSPSSLIRLYISTNTRPRLIQPSLPITYFGNAIMFSYSEITMSELIQANNLGLLASQIHKSIQDNNNNDIRTTLAWIMCQSDKTRIAPTCNLDENDFTISAWNKMGMYSDSDFELDNYPCRILLPPDTKFNGAAVLLSTEKNDQSIDVVLGLEINEMERLESNCDFRKYREDEK